MNNAAQSQSRSIAKRVYSALFCTTDCKYERVRGHKGLAYFKRQRAKRTRYKLRDQLRREA